MVVNNYKKTSHYQRMFVPTDELNESNIVKSFGTRCCIKPDEQLFTDMTDVFNVDVEAELFSMLVEQLCMEAVTVYVREFKDGANTLDLSSLESVVVTSTYPAFMLSPELMITIVDSPDYKPYAVEDTIFSTPMKEGTLVDKVVYINAYLPNHIACLFSPKEVGFDLSYTEGKDGSISFYMDLKYHADSLLMIAVTGMKERCSC